MFGDRRVDDALVAEFLQQPLRDLVGALIFGDLLAHNEDVGVAAHLLGHRVAQGLAHGHRDHRRSPAGNSRRAFGGAAGAAAARFSGGFRGAGGGASADCGAIGGSAAAGAALAAALAASSPSAAITAIGVLTATLSAPSGTRILDEQAFVDRFDLHRRLVGLDLGEDVAGTHRVALFLQPFRELALLHRRRKRGHENVGRHRSSLDKSSQHILSDQMREALFEDERPV